MIKNLFFKIALIIDYFCSIMIVVTNLTTMKKYLPIFLVILIVGGFWYFSQSKRGTISQQRPQQQQQEKKQEQKENKGKSFTGSLLDAVKLALPYKCTYKADKSEGTTYVKGTKAYMEFNNEGKKNYMIVVDKCFWVWDETKQGSKICSDKNYFEKTEEQKNEKVEFSGSNEAFKYQYQCQPTVINEAMFNPPTDVNFFDLEQLQKQIGQ